MAGWHHADRNERNGTLGLTWVHDNGCKIYQGRLPVNEWGRALFVYRLVEPDGGSGHFSMIKDAKAEGARYGQEKAKG
jgi:hypothetical protein